MSYNEFYDIKGIYDDSEKIKNYYDIKLLGKINNIKNIFSNNDLYICSISDIKFREKLILKFNNINWITIIHPNATISDTAKIGKGVFVNANCVINSQANISNHCIINTNVIVEHDVLIKENCVLSPSVTICGNVIINENTFIGCGTNIIDENKYGYIVIGKNNFITAGSLILHSTDDNSKIRGVF